MVVGYSGTTLVAKLGIKAGFEIYAAGSPEGYVDLIAPIPEGVKITARLSKNTDLIHIFAARKAELSAALRSYRSNTKPTVVIWVSWPKKSSKVPTDIIEDTIREVALPLGFVDIKVCAVTEVWSGLKLVVRKELR